MTHSAEEPRRRFYQRWTPFERMVVIVLAFAVIGMVAQGYIQRQTDQRQDDRLAAQAKEQRECLTDRLDALRDYLSQRGKLADRDRKSVARVLQSFATAARTGSQDRTAILKALRSYERAQRRLAEIRAEEPLPEFPGGDCVTATNDVPPAPEPVDEPKKKPKKGDNSDAPEVGSGSSGSSGSLRVNGPRSSGGSDKDSSRGGSGDGGGGGGGGSRPPSNPPDDDDDNILELEIPDLLLVEVDEEGQPKVTPAEGGVLDPEDCDE